MTKRLPSQGVSGAFKKAPKVSEAEYARVMHETKGAWDARVCTLNKSRYEIRANGIMAGNLVTICNNLKDFRWDNVDYAWYIEEAKKLII